MSRPIPIRALVLASFLPACSSDGQTGPDGTGSISGTVTSPQRGPLAGVTVISVPGGRSAVTLAGSGSYAIVDLRAGGYSASLSGVPSDCTDPGPQAATVTVGATTVVGFQVACTALGAGGLEGTVFARERGPIGRATVTLTPGGRSATTEPGTGAYAIHGLAPSRYTLSLSGLPDGCRNPGARFSVITEEETRRIDFGVPCSGLYVLDLNGRVAVFPPGAVGDVAPVSAIAGASTELMSPSGMAFDATYRLYVANRLGNSVAIFGPGVAGNASPTVSIEGPATGLDEPAGVAFAGNGQLYVSNAGSGEITVYPGDAVGDFSPVRSVGGPATLLSGPAGLAVDAAGRLYVANPQASVAGGNSITIYAPDAAGDAAPVAVISGPGTGLAGPAGVALDAAGRIYVANRDGNSITAYAPDASGNASPVTTIFGPATGLDMPVAAGFDAAGRLYVANLAAGVTIYAAGAAGDVAPIGVLGGPNTGLQSPVGVLVAR